jgi:hypothetical protein
MAFVKARLVCTFRLVGRADGEDHNGPAPLDEPVAYNHCCQQAYDLMSSFSGGDRFRENLRLFYSGEYTFP